MTLARKLGAPFRTSTLLRAADPPGTTPHEHRLAILSETNITKTRL
ncbi:hypothetical protein ACPW96_20750 [Micromonospora sp. DT81.3]